MKILFALKDIEYIDPMGVMLLSAIAKSKGHETGMAVLSSESIADAIKRERPDVVAFSAKTGEHKYYLQANRDIKRISPAIRTCIGGPHATFFPELMERHEFDALCVGEGDDAWADLLDAFEKNIPFDAIPNIVTKTNFSAGNVLRLRPKRPELDTLPFLDRGLVYSKTRLKRFPMRSFISSRGCPYKCTYCFNHKYNMLYKGNGPLYTRYSVDRLVAELKELKARYPTQFIKFYDDIFVLKDDAWLDEFAAKYSSRIGLPFHCLMRANLLTEAIMVKLKKAGLASISLSIESANNEIRNRVLKRNMSRETLLAAFRLCKKHDIPTFSNTIFAVPCSTIADDIESLELNLECNVTFGEFPLFFPYPRTELTDYAIAKGAFDGDFDSLHASYQSSSPLSSFTEKEKLMQRNLSLLSTVCLVFPRLKKPAVKVLMRLPLTPLYFAAYYLAKAYLIKTKIYPMRFSILDTLKGAYESLALELMKHFKEPVGQMGARETGAGICLKKKP